MSAFLLLSFLLPLYSLSRPSPSSLPVRCPPSVRFSADFEAVCRYFSCRVVIERREQLKAATPSLYVFGESHRRRKGGECDKMK